MRVGVAVLTALALGACTHAITLTPQDGVGPVGRGSAPGTLVSYHGTMSVELAGKTYAGDWTLQNAGGFVGTSFASGTNGFATGVITGASTNGNGRAYLTEPGGASISCEFSYSEASATGVGACRESGGKLYNLMIH